MIEGDTEFEVIRKVPNGLPAVKVTMTFTLHNTTEDEAEDAANEFIRSLVGIGQWSATVADVDKVEWGHFDDKVGDLLRPMK
jgi:hypothetical protein